jgi:hypothetical protein
MVGADPQATARQTSRRTSLRLHRGISVPRNFNECYIIDVRSIRHPGCMKRLTREVFQDCRGHGSRSTQPQQQRIYNNT